MVCPTDDRHIVGIKFDGEPEVQTLGEMTRIPDVCHEDRFAVHLIDVGALCSESFVGRHVLIPCGSADKGGRMLFPRSPNALGTEHTGFVG